MNYTFEYIFIPQILANDESDFVLDNVRVFDNLSVLQGSFEMEFGFGGDQPFDWDNLSITKYMSKGLSYWLLNFPPQIDEGDAVLGLIVQYEDEKPVYFTLENSLNGKYVLGKNEVGRHYYLCNVDERLDESDFINLVFNSLKRAPVSVSGFGF